MIRVYKSAGFEYLYLVREKQQRLFCNTIFSYRNDLLAKTGSGQTRGGNAENRGV
jgi:hypothetical protein